MATAEAFAKQILYWASQSKDEPTPITQMQLHKLLYYVQGWSLAAFGRPAFAARIEAWLHGPVVPEVYPLFKDSGKSPIEPVTNAPAGLRDDEQALVEWVMRQYGRYSASYLRELTHKETPWCQARGQLPEDQPSTAEMDHESMRTFFLAEQERHLKRHGLTLAKLLEIRQRASCGPAVPFDVIAGRASRA